MDTITAESQEYNFDDERRMSLKLFTFRLIDGRFVTYGGVTEPAAFRRANLYHPGAITGTELLHRVCSCATKCAKSTREAGYLICDRSSCAGVIL
ncbi:MAG: hypothetical protein JO277_09700 [Candidatus Eremiobacteraeota bacterium]|nr:hypothetical protein [Candidatus Eremiobacteraeota bacterium]